MEPTSPAESNAVSEFRVSWLVSVMTLSSFIFLIYMGTLRENKPSKPVQDFLSSTKLEKERQKHLSPIVGKS